MPGDETPPRASEEILERMRHCLWSEVGFFGRRPKPGYVCQYMHKALHGNWCRLYEASCSKFEVFPERYDT